MSEDRIRALSCWQGSISLDPIAGGITNVNYRVGDGAAYYMARVCEDMHYLGIDRRNERACQEAAARAGVAPDVVHCEDGILVSRFVDAPAFAADDLHDEQLLERLAAVLRRLHDARRNLTGEMLYFCPFQTVRTYTATALRLGATLPCVLDDHLEQAQRLADELAPFRPTLGHNDLLPANILDGGEQLWLVDWEYAGIGNPLFDIASVSSNAHLPDELEAMFIAAYAGTISGRMRREVQILKAVSLLREALWSVIQTVTSKLEFDYEKYAAENLNAFQEALNKLDSNTSL